MEDLGRETLYAQTCDKPRFFHFCQATQLIGACRVIPFTNGRGAGCLWP